MKKSVRSSLVLVMLAGLLAVLLAAPAWAASSKPEIPYDDGVPTAPNTLSVVVLQGSDYNMGYQYAQQLHQILGPYALKKWQRSFTKQELTGLRAYQWYIKKHTPEFLEWFKGAAAGATAAGVKVSYAQVLAKYCVGRAGGVAIYPGTEPPASKKDALPPKHCSGMAAWGTATKDGKLIAAGSTDGPGGGSPDEILLVAYPDTGNNYVVMDHGMGFPGMNNKGLAFVHHGSGVDGAEVPGYSVPGVLMLQHTLRYTDDAAQAVAMQLSYPFGNRASAGGLWADVSGHGLDIECRSPRVVRKAGDYGEEDFIYASNSCLATRTDAGEPMGPVVATGQGHGLGWPLNYFPHGGWNMDDMNSVRRDLYAWNMLHNYLGAVDLEFVKMFWRMPSTGLDYYPSLEAAEQDLNATHGGNGHWDTYMGNLGNGHVGIVQPDNGNNGRCHYCIGPLGRHVEPLSQGYHGIHRGATHTCFELQLAATAPEAVRAAKARSQYDLYDANKQLRKLTYHDVAYAPLDAIFNKAATESQKGDWYLGLAAAAKGNEQVCAYGKALRAFTRCQVYAKQVYEALVPPADDPTDLPGLADMPWFGDWAEEGAWLTAPSGDDASGNP